MLFKNQDMLVACTLTAFSGLISTAQLTNENSCGSDTQYHSSLDQQTSMNPVIEWRQSKAARQKKNGKPGFRASITVQYSLWISHMYSLEQRQWLSSMVLVWIYYEAVKYT